MELGVSSLAERVELGVFSLAERVELGVSSLAERVELGVSFLAAFKFSSVAGTSTTVTSGTVSLSSCTGLLSLTVSLAE